MRTTLTMSQEDIVAAVSEALASKKQKIKSSRFDVEEQRDAFDRPTGGHTVELEIEVEDDHTNSQR